MQIGTRARKQPPPPRVVFESLSHPDLARARPWLRLLDDEVPPTVRAAEAPATLTWTSLWVKRPDAEVRFDLRSDGSEGTLLRWTLLVRDPPPDAALTGHLRKRLNELINADLRFSYGQ